MKITFEGPVQINDTIINSAWARRQHGARLVIRDSACQGLALVVNATSMTWRFDYRPRGTIPATGKRWPNNTITINHDPNDPDRRPFDKIEVLPAGKARQEARRLRGMVESGKDPATAKREDRKAAIAARARTLGLLADEYATLLPKRPKLRGTGTPSPAHVATEMRALRAAIREMDVADKPADELKAADIRRMLAAHGAQPAAGRARLGALSRFLDWAADDERISANPCTVLSKAHRPRPPAARSGFLSPAALADLWLGVAALDPVRRDYVRFMIAIPCRRGEASSLDWRHLDLSGAVWSQPGKLTKNRDPHRFYLHPLALALLTERHAAAGQPRTGLVFPAPGGRIAKTGEPGQAPAVKTGASRAPAAPPPISRAIRPLTTWRDIKDEAIAASGVTGWTLHDFRRSFATALGEYQPQDNETKMAESVIDAILNHRQSVTRAGVMGSYQRSARWPEQTLAMKQWGAILSAAIDAAKVLQPSAGPADAAATE